MLYEDLIINKKIVLLPKPKDDVPIYGRIRAGGYLSNNLLALPIFKKKKIVYALFFPGTI